MQKILISRYFNKSFSTIFDNDFIIELLLLIYSDVKFLNYFQCFILYQIKIFLFVDKTLIDYFYYIESLSNPLRVTPSPHISLEVKVFVVTTQYGILFGFATWIWKGEWIRFHCNCITSCLFNCSKWRSPKALQLVSI